MKTIKLLVGERIAIQGLLNELYTRGGLDLKGLSQAQKIVDKVGILEEERKKLDWKVDFASNTLTWNTAKDKGKEIDLSQDEIKMVKEAIKDKNTKKGFSLADRHILSLATKLDIQVEEIKND